MESKGRMTQLHVLPAMAGLVYYQCYVTIQPIAVYVILALWVA